MADKALEIMEYVKSANLKGKVEIIDDDVVLWDLDGVCLKFLIDDGTTTILYSRRKNMLFAIGHCHEDNCDVINLIQDINSEDNMVHITVFLGSSLFAVEHKTKQKKKSWLLVRHYYSRL